MVNFHYCVYAINLKGSRGGLKIELFMTFLVPPLCQEMHFRLIGRKKFFTQVEWALSPPQASKRENSERTPKRRRAFGVHSLFSLFLAGGGEVAHSV